MYYLKILVILVLFLLSENVHPTLCQTKDIDYYFYHPRSYGSDYIFNPLTNILSLSFGITNLLNQDNSLDVIDFSAGFQEVNSQLANPLNNIEKYGWEKFLKQEV